MFYKDSRGAEKHYYLAVLATGAGEYDTRDDILDGSYRGYARCDVARDNWRTTFMGVPTEPPNGSVVTPESPATSVATFVVEKGRPGAVQERTTTTTQAATYTGPSEPFDPSRIN